MWKVQLFELNFDEQELQAIKEVFDSKWITMGEKTQLFEEMFVKFLGSEVHAVALSSGTAALHIALLASGVNKGDEVVIPSLTFVADLNVVELVGAKPVLADCESFDNWNVSAKTVEQVVTDKTKAVIIVHYAGYPCDMEDIIKLCRKRNIFLIEDCAHSPGALYKSTYTGCFGDFGCFSFFTNKNLSVGEGGMIVSKSKALIEKAGYLRSHGMTSLTLNRFKERAVSYDVVMPGLNYRIDEFRSAIGLVQLKKLKKANLYREKLVKRYREKLAQIHEVTVPFLNLNEDIYKSAYHIMPILLDKKVNRNIVIEKLKERGVQTSIHYHSFREFSYYKNKLNACPIAEEISARELTLPLHTLMSFEDVDYVVDSLKEAIREGYNE